LHGCIVALVVCCVCPGIISLPYYLWWVPVQCPRLFYIWIKVGIFVTQSCHAMESSGVCRQRIRNSSVSSLHSEPIIDPDNDLRDPIISSPDVTDDECDEVSSFVYADSVKPVFFACCLFRRFHDRVGFAIRAGRKNISGSYRSPTSQSIYVLAFHIWARYRKVDESTINIAISRHRSNLIDLSTKIKAAEPMDFT